MTMFATGSLLELLSEVFTLAPGFQAGLPGITGNHRESRWSPPGLPVPVKHCQFLKFPANFLISSPTGLPLDSRLECKFHVDYQEIFPVESRWNPQGTVHPGIHQLNCPGIQ